MNDVAIVILIHHHTRRWRRRQRELDAALQAVAARLHPRLHHAFADGLVVEEAGDVADGVIHDYDTGLWALGSGLWALGSGLWALGFGLFAPGSGWLRRDRRLDRIRDVDLVDRRVNLLALAADPIEKPVRVVAQDFVHLAVVE